MTPRRGAAGIVFVSLCCAAVALPGAAAAQVVPSQAEKYLMVTDVGDARALFVNPAGLARSIEASIGGFITGVDSTAGAQVSQFGALVASRGVAFGWQHDDLTSGASGNTLVLGLGMGGDDFSVGGDHRWYSGDAKGGSWDAAVRGRVAIFDLAAVWRNIGSPTVTTRNPAGTLTLEEALVAGAAIDLGSRARLSGEWHVATSGFPTRFVRAAAIVVAGRGAAFSVTGSFSSDPTLRSMTFALQLHAPRFRAAVFDRESSGPGTTNEFGAAGSAVAPAPPGPPARPRR